MYVLQYIFLFITSECLKVVFYAPILFTIYINDISKATKDVKFVMYADDTTIFFS